MKTTLLPNKIDPSFLTPAWRREGPIVENRPATKHLAKMGSQRVTRWACRITFGAECTLPSATLDTWLNVDDHTYHVAIIAPSADAARNYLCELTACTPCVEIEVFGPKGGLASHSYRGWESAIWHQLMREQLSDKAQLSLL